MDTPIIDTHQHLVYPDKWPYSWTAGIPALGSKIFHLKDYLNAIRGTGITRAVFMETAVDDPHSAKEAKSMCDMASEPGAITCGVIASCRPEEKDGFAAYLDSIHHPKLVGLRRILHVVPDELSASDHFAENLKLLPAYNLTFDMCFLARQLPAALSLARRCENVSFILDHCGVPDIAGRVLDPWRDHILQLAALPNVSCKISGVIANCDPRNATAEAVRPYVEYCLEHFGWDRVVWGGDWPVCNMTSSLAAWVAISREIVRDADPADRKKLFHDNAIRIYGLA